MKNTCSYPAMILYLEAYAGRENLNNPLQSLVNKKVLKQRYQAIFRNTGMFL